MVDLDDILFNEDKLLTAYDCADTERVARGVHFTIEKLSRSG